MGRMTLEQLKAKWGTEGIRTLARYMQDMQESGSDITQDGIELMIEVLTDVGNTLTEEVV